MSGNDHALSRLDFWNDDVIPVWESTFDCKFKRFASWKFISWNISIKWILNYFLVLVQFGCMGNVEKLPFEWFHNIRDCFP